MNKALHVGVVQLQYTRGRIYLVYDGRRKLSHHHQADCRALAKAKHRGLFSSLRSLNTGCTFSARLLLTANQ